jgi:hypothetical protein
MKTHHKKHIQQLNNLGNAHWSLNLYPDAREAGGTFITSRAYPRNTGLKGYAKDPQRSAEEAARRASGRIRRYASANGLNRLGTLTYKGAGCHDQIQARQDISEFFISLRQLTKGKNLAYIWVPEWHPNGHGIHLHFAVGKYIKRSIIEESWPHGFVHIKLIGDLPAHSSVLDESRIAARYLSKYVSKSFLDEKRIFGKHRYDLAQGFKPPVVKMTGTSPYALLSLANEQMGRHPRRQWSSKDVENWHGAPAFWAQW